MAENDTVKKIEALAEEHGYNCVGYTEASKLVPTEKVRDMCAANTCHSYDRNWSCPPACGDVESFEKRLHGYEHVVVFETVAELEDEFDIDTMMDTNDDHKERMIPFADAVREIVPDCLFLAAGPCTICGSTDECAYPDEPCRFPEKQFVAMEAAGLVVSEVCTAAGIPYNHGSDHIAYVSCVAF
ncbi:MAG: DUF2284 domain-containing protein [Coriobacteriales bacterium]|jgi:predicted metal-binding protein